MEISNLNCFPNLASDTCNARALQLSNSLTCFSRSEHSTERAEMQLVPTPNPGVPPQSPRLTPPKSPRMTPDSDLPMGHFHSSSTPSPEGASGDLSFLEKLVEPISQNDSHENVLNSQALSMGPPMGPPLPEAVIRSELLSVLFGQGLSTSLLHQHTLPPTTSVHSTANQLAAPACHLTFQPQCSNSPGPQATMHSTPVIEDDLGHGKRVRRPAKCADADVPSPPKRKSNSNASQSRQKCSRPDHE